MVLRVRACRGEVGDGRVDADTIHGFALDWLMRFGQSVNVYPDTVVYAEDADRLALLTAIVRQLGEPDVDLRPILRAIDEHRSQTSDPNHAPITDPSVGSVPFAELYDAYLAALDVAGGIDFPGMLIKFLEATALDPGFIRNFAATFRHVLVDEGQDLSPAQAAVVKQLATGNVSLFVVADDRQSINGFAGGGFENVRKLVGAEAAANALRLPHNFRCATAVLHVSEQLAAQLRNRPRSAMAAENAPPGRVRVITAATAADEADIVARWTAHLLFEGLDPDTLAAGEDPAVDPEDIAIIARSRWLLDAAVEALAAQNIAVSVQTDASGFLTTPHGRIVAEGLALLASPDNRPARRRISDELRGLGIDSADDTSSLPELLRRTNSDDLVLLAQMLDGASITDIEERLSVLSAAIDDSEWIDDLRTLALLSRNYAASVQPHRRDLSGFLRFMNRTHQTRPTDPGVRVLTIHKVKGLEFKAVCLIGAYDGAIPDYRSVGHAEPLDEERRAFYVAPTRASRELLVTYPETTVDRYGRSHRQQPSTFAREAGLL